MMEHAYDESFFMSEHYNRQTRFMPRSVFGAPTPILFEDAMLMGVECPHEYLEEEYGDYMQLPPEEKRKPLNLFRKLKLRWRLRKTYFPFLFAK